MEDSFFVPRVPWHRREHLVHGKIVSTTSESLDCIHDRAAELIRKFAGERFEPDDDHITDTKQRRVSGACTHQPKRWRCRRFRPRNPAMIWIRPRRRRQPTTASMTLLLLLASILLLLERYGGTIEELLHGIEEKTCVFVRALCVSEICTRRQRLPAVHGHGTVKCTSEIRSKGERPASKCVRRSIRRRRRRLRVLMMLFLAAVFAAAADAALLLLLYLFFLLLNCVILQERRCC